MRNALLTGFYGKHNFGDEIMLKSIKQMFSNINFVVSEKVEDLDKYDLIFIGGGGIINEKFWIFKHLDILQNKKIVFINVNVTKDLFDNKLFFESLKKLNAYWIVRDRYSYNNLKKEVNVIFAQDISYFYFKDYKKGKKTKQMSIVCNYYIFENLFRDNAYLSNKTEHVYYALDNFCKWMKSFGWKINLVPASTDQIIDDRLTNAILGCMIKDTKFIVNEIDIIPTLLNSELIISSRYHFSYFALCKKIMLLDIYHHDKNKNLLIDANIEDIGLNFYTLSADEMKNKIITLEGNKNAYVNKAEIYLKNVENNWEEVKKEVNKLYE